MNFDKCLVKCKGKVIQLQADVTQRVGRGLALLFHDRGTRRGWVVSKHASAAIYPRKRPGTPFYRRLGGPHGRSGRAENLVSTGIWSLTVQPLAQSV